MLSSVGAALGFLTRGQRAAYGTLIALRALCGVLDIVGVVLVGFLAGVGAGQFLTDGKPLTLLGFQLPRLDATGLLWLVVAILGVFVLKAIAGLTLTRSIALFVARTETENSRRIAEYVLEGPLPRIQRFSKTEFQFAVTASTGNAFTQTLVAFATLVSEGFLLLLVIATFIAVSPLTALVVLLYFGAVIAVIQFVIQGRLKRVGQAMTEGFVGSGEVVNDAFDSFREISVLRKQPFFLDRFMTARVRLSRATGTQLFLAQMPRYIIETALMLGVVMFVAWLFLTGSIATGLSTLGIFLTGGVRLMSSMLPIQNALAQMRSSVEQGRLALELLGERARAEAAGGFAPIETRTETGELPDHALDVELRDVRFTYAGNEEPTLRDIDLLIPAGGRIAFIGPSGAGKTTIVDVLLGLATPDAGSVRIGGADPVELRTLHPGLIGYVPQRPGIVSGTIAENVALGVPAERIDHARLAEVLAAAHLDDFVAGLPEGSATSVGKQANALSGGQIQRLGLARALYPRPRLLILDEATSALDAGSEAFITETLEALGAETTVIVVAHRLSTVQFSDAVHVVDEGRITASGTFAQLRRDVPMVAEYVKLMSFED